jgi:hypothetical protein
MAMACMERILELAFSAMGGETSKAIGGHESSAAESWSLYTFCAGFAEPLVFRKRPAYRGCWRSGGFQPPLSDDGARVITTARAARSRQYYGAEL